MIISNVVISHDYFKYALANVQNMLGGRLTSYESVVERARREAIVRLKLEAEKIGATQIMGIRLSTTELGIDRKSTRLNSSHVKISYAVFCLKKKKRKIDIEIK